MVKYALTRLWHGLCIEARTMKNGYRSLPKRGRLEFFFSLLLLCGILTALVAPERSRALPRNEENALFTLMEADYINPLFTSASGIRILNGATKHVALFAGYDEFSTRVDIDGNAIVANVTRFSGDLLAMLNVAFVSRLRTVFDEPHIFITESFRQKFLADKGNVLGTILRINCSDYRIAGITREGADLFNGTDIWIPVRSRGPLGTMNSMKIMGTLALNNDWRSAEQRIHAALESCGFDQTYSEATRARLLPVAKRIQFEAASSVVLNGTGEDDKRQGYHQTAAFPLTRGS